MVHARLLGLFQPLPEWGTQHTSPLLKPVTNAVGYLNYSLFGRSYALHFATFFLMQFLGLLVFVRLLRELAVTPLPTAVMALLFLFNPAFMNTGLIRWAAASVLLVFSAATVVQSVRSVRLALAWQSVIAPERALHDALKMLPQDGGTVYVVNAPPLLVSAPHHLHFAWSLNLNVVIVNQFWGCPTSSDTGSTQLTEAGADLTSVRIPDYAWLVFGSVPPEVVSGGIGTALKREGIGAYIFPTGSLPGTIPSNWAGRLHFKSIRKEHTSHLSDTTGRVRPTA